MNEQAGALQDYIRRKNLTHLLTARTEPLPGSGRVITVSSGKGGVGKTTLTLNLALASPEQALVVDGDFLLGNIGTFLNKNPARNWTDILQSPETWNRGLIQLNETTAVLAGASPEDERQLRASLSTDRLVSLLRQWRESFDLIFIDTASGLGAQVLEWCLAANRIMVVSTPEPAACTDAYALVKSLSLTEKIPPVGVLINDYLPGDDPLSIFNQLNVMTERFLDQRLEYYGAVPRSGLITESTRQQEPVMLSKGRDEIMPHMEGILSRLTGNEKVHEQPVNAIG